MQQAMLAQQSLFAASAAAEVAISASAAEILNMVDFIAYSVCDLKEKNGSGLLSIWRRPDFLVLHGQGDDIFGREMTGGFKPRPGRNRRRQHRAGCCGQAPHVQALHDGTIRFQAAGIRLRRCVRIQAHRESQQQGKEASHSDSIGQIATAQQQLRLQ